MHFTSNSDSPHTATLLDESHNERAHRESVDAVNRRLQHCGEHGRPPLKTSLVLRAEAPRLELLAPRFQNDELGEHLVVLLLGLHRIRTLQPGFQISDLAHHAEQLQAGRMRDHKSSGYLTTDLERFDGKGNDERTDMIRISRSSDPMNPVLLRGLGDCLFHAGQHRPVRRVGEVSGGQAIPAFLEQLRRLHEQLAGLSLSGQQPVGGIGQLRCGRPRFRRGLRRRFRRLAAATRRNTQDL